MDELTETEITATCHTEKCDNAGIPIALIWMGDTAPYVVCGVCSQQITDVV